MIGSVIVPLLASVFIEVKQLDRLRNLRFAENVALDEVQCDFKPSDKMPIRARSSGAAPTYVRSSSG